MLEMTWYRGTIWTVHDTDIQSTNSRSAISASRSYFAHACRYATKLHRVHSLHCNAHCGHRSLRMSGREPLSQAFGGERRARGHEYWFSFTRVRARVYMRAATAAAFSLTLVLSLTNHVPGSRVRLFWCRLVARWTSLYLFLRTHDATNIIARHNIIIILYITMRQ